MNRFETLQMINQHLSGCQTCTIKMELTEQYKQNYSHIDGYCLKQCPVGKELKELGKELNSGRTTKIPSWWDGSGSDIDDDYIIPEEAG